jgi:presenilin-like A22 family membrane protease
MHIHVEHVVCVDRKATRPWLRALHHVLPLYLVQHILCILLTLFANLFQLGNFSPVALPLYTLLTDWNRWDTGQFTGICLGKGLATLRSAFSWVMLPAIVSTQCLPAVCSTLSVQNTDVLMVRFQRYQSTPNTEIVRLLFKHFTHSMTVRILTPRSSKPSYILCIVLKMLLS